MSSPAGIGLNDLTHGVPTVAESAEALEFIGFVPDTASRLFQSYHNRPDPNINPDGLIDYVYGHLSSLNSTRWAALTPRESMSRLGVTEKQQDAIMNPRFTSIFWTESLLFWLKDTFRINYATLLQLQSRLKNNVRGGSYEHERASIQGIFPGQSPAQPQATLSVNMTSSEFSLPANHIALGSEGSVLPNHVVLYKGKAATEKMFEDNLIRDDGSLDMDVLATYEGGDFNHDRKAWYWAADKDVAEMYREWAAIRCKWSETWLIRIQIPNTFMNGLSQRDLWYGADWKEYIWHCKKTDLPPAKFDQYWRETGCDVLRGHICTGNGNLVARIKKENVQTSITADNVLTTRTNSRAVQYVFMHGDRIERLGEVIRGKLHIEITGATDGVHKSLAP